MSFLAGVAPEIALILVLEIWGIAILVADDIATDAFELFIEITVPVIAPAYGTDFGSLFLLLGFLALHYINYKSPRAGH
jgi:hypothetical protein